MDKKEEKIFSRPRIKMRNINFLKLKENKKIGKILTIIAIFLIAIIVVDTILKAITPIIDEQCRGLAKSIATKVSNEQATKVMADYKYEDFCKVIKDDNDNIKMINTNMITINKIISDIPILIQEELEKEEVNTFNIKMRKFYRKQIFFRNWAKHKNKNDDRRNRGN